MIGIILTIIKTLILLGILVIIHEGGHLFVAKLCKVKVNEFSIGFGKVLFSRQRKETKYSIRLIPLGGFVSMEGEEQPSGEEGSFSEAGILKKLAIISAGAIVNIIFGLLVYFILVAVHYGIQVAWSSIGPFIGALGESIKMLFTREAPVNYLAVISLSLGITNLIPIPPLDGGKFLIYVIEWIKRKPLKEETSLKIQMAGFIFIIGLSMFVMYNDIVKIL